MSHLNLDNTLIDKIKSHKLTNWLNKKFYYYHDYQILSYKAVSQKDILITMDQAKLLHINGTYNQF